MADEDQAVRLAPFASPMQQFGSSILQLTNPESEIIKMELTMRAQVLDKDGNPVSVGDPLLNEAGVTSVIGQVQTVINQVTIMSNFEDKDIPLLVDFLGDTLSRDLMMNRVNYEISTPAARDKIYFAALAGSYICLKRALNNGERGFWKGSQQDIRQFIDSGQQSKGLFGFLGWGNKRQ
jgi:hypothetical protein